MKLSSDGSVAPGKEGIGTDLPAVSVVIVNWNTVDLLRDCLRSIEEQTSVSHEIIVIDNASSDGSVAMVRAEFLKVVLIANKENRGFAAANNQGLLAARGEVLLLLNPDTIILQRAIEKMLSWLKHRPDVGCVGCQVLEGPDIIQQTCFADTTPLNLMFMEFGLVSLMRWFPVFGNPRYTGWDRKSERNVDVVSGMFMLVPRPVMEKVGILDEAFFIYEEEADWCRRIRAAGYSCVFTPEAQIIHLDGGSKSTSQIRSRMYIQLQKSHLIYVKKHHGHLGYVAVKLIYVGASMLRLGRSSVKQLIGANAETKAQIRLALAALRYHLTGKEPVL